MIRNDLQGMIHRYLIIKHTFGDPYCPLRDDPGIPQKKRRNHACCQNKEGDKIAFPTHPVFGNNQVYSGPHKENVRQLNQRGKGNKQSDIEYGPILICSDLKKPIAWYNAHVAKDRASISGIGDME